jgi:DNA topoisomerase-3
MDVCLGANRHLRVLRARFSALVASELARSIQRLVPPNAADAAAVDARQEIDLRVGASFTRLQTLLLQVRGRRALGRGAAGTAFAAASQPDNPNPMPLPIPRPCPAQNKFDWLAGGLANDKPLLSYGPCQFPTLGLIVQRSWWVVVRGGGKRGGQHSRQARAAVVAAAGCGSRQPPSPLRWPSTAGGQPMPSAFLHVCVRVLCDNAGRSSLM